MPTSEEVVQFKADGKVLYGILHHPERAAIPNAALLMVVGGPQTRVGSHRSYTLVARELCAKGMVVMRFDYHGLGDSEGDFVGFTQAGPSIEAAIHFLAKKLSDQGRILLWSLCDGSAACAFKAKALSGESTKIKGMILCNPYVHSVQGKAKAYLKYYYVRRILEASFWKKILSLQLNPIKVVNSLFQLLNKASKKGEVPTHVIPGEDPPELPEKVMEGLEAFPGPLRLILSGNDLTAMEFLTLFKARGSQARRDKIQPTRFKEKRVAATVVLSAPAADHTFTTGEWKSTLIELTWDACKDILGGKEA